MSPFSKPSARASSNICATFATAPAGNRNRCLPLIPFPTAPWPGLWRGRNLVAADHIGEGIHHQQRQLFRGGSRLSRDFKLRKSAHNQGLQYFGLVLYQVVNGGDGDPDISARSRRFRASKTAVRQHFARLFQGSACGAFPYSGVRVSAMSAAVL